MYPLSMFVPAPAGVLQQRRAALASALDCTLVLFAGHAQARNYATNPHPFRAASTYLYYGGPALEHALVVIEPGSNGVDGCSLFRVPTTADDTLWTGPVWSDRDIASACGFDMNAILDVEHFSRQVQAQCHGILPPCHETIAQAQKLGITDAPQHVIETIISARLIKDEYELTEMRSAAQVTVKAHRAAMVAAQPGCTEAAVAGAFHAVLTEHHCQPSFTPIVTTDGQVLHNHSYGNTLEEGDLLLVDGGAEVTSGYASDVTRTYAVGAKWTDIQRQLYNTVERALNEAISACTPTRRYREVHDHAAEVICTGLVNADLLRGDPAELSRRFAHTLFFPHGVGHLIGLDVHDMEEFGDLAGYQSGRTRRSEFGNKFLRLDRDLAAGMCVTVEPGIYLVPDIWDSHLVKPFDDVVNRREIQALLDCGFGGIRLEQTVCVRNGQPPEVLTENLALSISEVSAINTQADAE